MTFTEAAIEVLRREGKPLHFKKIAEIAVRESLLDHVGKVPDDTMADQLAAHCRLPHEDRRVIPILSGTFALVEWGMDEDPAGLENLIEAPPLIDVPYRGRERHPIPSREVARGGGRAEGRRRREEEGARPRRFPPPAEVAYEILAGAGRSLSLVEIAAQGAERLLMPDAFVRDGNALRAALLEDNRRREGGGRRALFEIEGESVTLVAQPEPGEQPVVAAPRAAVTAADARRAGLAALRRRLRECDGPTMEHVVCRLLEKMGFTELKVAKRGREHVIYTARRKLGLGDVRHGIRILRTSGEIGRRDVTELRRDLGHYGAQIGAVVSAGEAARDVRGEAGAPGQLPVILLCGEALAEAFSDAAVGCAHVMVPEVDDAFFREAAEAAEQEEAARRARREERDRREGKDRDGRRRGERGAEDRPAQVIAAAGAEEPAAEAGEAATEPRILEVAASLPADEAPEAAGEEAELEGDDEGDDADADAEGAGAESGAPEVAASGEGASEPGAAGERRRRRRRRRRRGGRGRAREAGAAGGQVGEGAAAAEGGAPGAKPEGGGASTSPPPEPSAPTGEPGPQG
jgi:hypothetical protein